MAKGIRKKMKLKKGDRVIVRTGRDKGKTGEVLGVFPEQDKVLVSNINMLWHHDAPSQKDAGGRTQKEGKIHVSNLSILDPSEDKPTRIGYKTLENGEKARVAKRSGETLDNV